MGPHISVAIEAAQAGGKILKNYFVASNSIIHDDLIALTKDLYPDAKGA